MVKSCFPRHEKAKASDLVSLLAMHLDAENRAESNETMATHKSNRVVCL
jgi:hypothetical protein